MYWLKLQSQRKGIIKMSYYYNEEVNSLFLLLDEEFFTKWEDRNYDPHTVSQFYCVHDILNLDNYIIDCDTFEDDFILVDDDNLEEFSNNIFDYDIDELTLAKIKKQVKELMG